MNNFLSVLSLGTVLVSGSLMSFASQAQSQRPQYDLPNISGAPQLDGQLDDQQWKNALQIELKTVQYLPSLAMHGKCSFLQKSNMDVCL